jgi:RimJ/RimL family protein N-acetyltransferase
MIFGMDAAQRLQADFEIAPLGLLDLLAFAVLRNDIEEEARHLVVSNGERKESALRILGRMLISGRRINTLVARNSGEFIGYVSLTFPRFRKLRGNAYLSISVRSTYQGRGVGTELMREAERYARERGIRRIELEVFGKNDGAYRLYRRLGYEEEGRKRRAVFDQGEFDDIIVMAKFIA